MQLDPLRISKPRRERNKHPLHSLKSELKSSYFLNLKKMIKEEDVRESVDEIDYSLNEHFIVKNDEKNQKIYVPKPIIESESVFSIDFHPKLDLLAVALVTGETKM